MRQVRRVSKRSFKKTLKKLKMIFSDSKVFCLEISAGADYERARPGVSKRVVEYNNIINEVYGEDCVSLMGRLQKEDGFNVDNFHLNAIGHQIVADTLKAKISHCLKTS